MSVIEEWNDSLEQQFEQFRYPVQLQAGAKAVIKHTGQIVELKQVSEHGISMVTFRTGGDYLMSNKFLEPVLIYQ